MTSNVLDEAAGCDVRHLADMGAIEESSSDSNSDDEIPIRELPNPTVVTRRGDDMVSWDLISNFSLENLEGKYKRHAPVTWHVLSRFAECSQHQNTVRAVQRKNRPLNIVRPFVLSPVKYGRQF